MRLDQVVERRRAALERRADPVVHQGSRASTPERRRAPGRRGETGSPPRGRGPNQSQSSRHVRGRSKARASPIGARQHAGTGGAASACPPRWTRGATPDPHVSRGQSSSNRPWRPAPAAKRRGARLRLARCDHLEARARVSLASAAARSSAHCSYDDSRSLRRQRCGKARQLVRQRHRRGAGASRARPAGWPGPCAAPRRRTRPGR